MNAVVYTVRPYGDIFAQDVGQLSEKKGNDMRASQLNGTLTLRNDQTVKYHGLYFWNPTKGSLNFLIKETTMQRLLHLSQNRVLH